MSFFRFSGWVGADFQSIGLFQAHGFIENILILTKKVHKSIRPFPVAKMAKIVKYLKNRYHKNQGIEDTYDLFSGLKQNK